MNRMHDFSQRAKRIYWERRLDPFGLHHLKRSLHSTVRHWYGLAESTCEISRYKLTGKANSGHCPVCEENTTFLEKASWLRDNYLCAACRSIPRVRHIVHVLQKHFPQFREYAIHESSGSGPSFNKFRNECRGYVPTYFWPDAEPGSLRSGCRCENLEALTFPEASFDLVITQDVMEHVMNPDRAFSEIGRSLKPGGAHVFTVPWYSAKRTFIRAAANGDEIEYYEKKEFHGNPIDESGALVVTEWGADLPEFIFKHSGMITTVYFTHDRYLGLDGEFLEVFVSKKPA